MKETASVPEYRLANEQDLEALYAGEMASFDADRLSLRRFKHLVQVKHGILMLCHEKGEVLAYGLVCGHKGTRLERPYPTTIPA